ncbi:sigma-54-dependent Fis family transcriptional regulator [bacterium]|nr:sigma-54-dependent Fis family transcriptional regulator [bacterium]
MTPKPLILVVDDEPAILKMLKDSLEDEGFRVETVSQGNSVLDAIGRFVPDAVLLDIFMPNFDGLTMLKQIKQEYPQQAVIMVSGFGTIQIAIQALQQGAMDFIEKPFNLSDVLEKLAFTKASTSLTDADTGIRRSYLVGESRLFNELLSQAQILASLNLPVIIYGPSGCGKQSLARYIHDVGAQQDLPFVAVDAQRLVHIEEHTLRQPATLFVRRIDLADESNQRRALQILTGYPDIRIIASSLPSLFSRMRQGLCDATLFCKLNVTPLEISALNKRRYDIPLLANHFLQEANQTHSKAVSLTADAVRLLRNHDWHGDVAQLKDFIRLLVAQAPGNKHVPVTFDALFLKKILPEEASSFFEEQSYTRFASIDDATQEFQREYISHLLQKYRYDMHQLAEFLNISVDTLNDTMHKLHITLH